MRYRPAPASLAPGAIAHTCHGRKRAALRRPLIHRTDQTVFHHPGVEKRPDESEHTLIGHSRVFRPGQSRQPDGLRVRVVDVTQSRRCAVAGLLGGATLAARGARSTESSQLPRGSPSDPEAVGRDQPARRQQAPVDSSDSGAARGAAEVRLCVIYFKRRRARGEIDDPESPDARPRPGRPHSRPRETRT